MQDLNLQISGKFDSAVMNVDIAHQVPIPSNSVRLRNVLECTDGTCGKGFQEGVPYRGNTDITIEIMYRSTSRPFAVSRNYVIQGSVSGSWDH